MSYDISRALVTLKTQLRRATGREDETKKLSTKKGLKKPDLLFLTVSAYRPPLLSELG